jgi:pyruvate kinase
MPPVVLDLQGAKIRVGTYPFNPVIPEHVKLSFQESSEDPGIIPIPHESVFRQTSCGDHLFFNDGKVRVKITEKPAEDCLEGILIRPGPLSSGKGINSPDRVYEMARVTTGDQESIRIGNEFPFVEFAVSFVGTGEEANLFRPLVGNRRLSAKIERAAAFTHLLAIDAVFDELWLCRGDLGAECGLAQLGPLQAEFIRWFPQLTRPKILAGEVLGSMVLSPLPSRSEIVHLYDVMQAGFNGFVLSDETAMGANVPAVLEFLKTLTPRSSGENSQSSCRPNVFG